MLKFVASLCLLCALLASPIQADVNIVVDGFESYADTAAFQATWVETIGSGTGIAHVADDNSSILTADAAIFPGIQGKAVYHIGATSSNPGMVNQWRGVINQRLGVNPAFTIHPSASQSIVLKADVFISNSGDERMTVGLRSVTANPDNTVSTANLLEMGQYNANLTTEPVVPGSPRVSTQFGYRLALFGAVSSPVTSQPSWQYFALAPELDRTTDADTITNLADIGAGWHTYAATITPESITLTLDLFRDGKTNLTRDLQTGAIAVGFGANGVDASITYEIETLAAGFNSLRIGGPSGSSSPGLGANAFDNFSLRLVDTAPPATPGDFNLDGTVDAADYVVWRKTSRPTSDYNLWRTHFGESLPGSGAAQSAAVPEPSSLTLLVVLIGLASCAARK